MASVGKKKASGMCHHSTRPIQHIRLSKSRQTCQRYFTPACPQPQYRNRGTNEINHRNSKITECSLGCPCAGATRTDAPRNRSHELCRIRKGGIMAEPILVNTPSRTLRELYGDPPPGVVPNCTPSRGAQTTDEWYAEQERQHGKYAELKAKRPKRNWFGQKEEQATQQEPVQQEPLQLPARQQPRLSVQQQIRQRLQLTDNSNATATETEDGIHWVVFEGEKVSRW